MFFAIYQSIIMQILPVDTYPYFINSNCRMSSEHKAAGWYDVEN